MLNRLCKSIYCALMLILLSAVSLPAQITTGEITGTVMDQSGAVIPGFEAGKVPDYATIENLTTFVQGIVGQIPKS